ncbi:MAG: TonB-dependent receptor [Bacteroidota bacterium]
MNKIIIIIGLIFISNITIANTIKYNINDTAITIKVLGNCGQCKDRIEDAVKVKGVDSASWDEDTILLSVRYNPNVISLDKLHTLIAKAGHDTELKKANDKVYNKLPDCCKYRIETSETMHHTVAIRGVVMEEDKKGNFKPLVAASIRILNSTEGVKSDENGMFSLLPSSDSTIIVVSDSGFKSDTIAINNQKQITVILASNNQLKDVTVMARQGGMYASTVSTMKTLMVNEKELFKAACCNLSESFETNPSVDVSYSDGITGSKQIQMLGLSGIYTQLTVENMPGPRGLATANGLSFIPGTWIESMQLTKGTGSVVNGFESIAGQINIEEKKPEKSEALYANLYVNETGKTDINLNLSQKVNRKWSTALLLHDDFMGNKSVDMNNDGFRDIPYGNLFTLMNRWKYDNGKGLMGQVGVRLLWDDKTGGSLNFNPVVDKTDTTHYGLALKTERYEVFAKLGYVFPKKKYKSIGFQVAAFKHNQDDYFGFTDYSGVQHNVYGNLIYQSIINSTIHKFRTGLSFLYDDYKEVLDTNHFVRKEIVPGAFGEYTFLPNNKFSIVAGLRVDNHSMFGTFVTPRLHIRYQPFSKTTIRLSGGRGQRTANIIAENLGMLASSRGIIFPLNHINENYGFKPEVAWNEGISIDQKLRLFGKEATFSIEYFRTDFTNQVVVDMYQSAKTVNIYNLNGASYSNAFQTELNFIPLKNVEVRVAYRWFDVATNYSGMLMDKPLVAKNRAFMSLDYETKNKWKFDYTVQWVSSKQLPYLKDNTAATDFPEQSPAYWQMTAQVSKGWKNVDVYLGVENLTDYKQDHLIIDPTNAFGKNFDASVVWGPAYGRMFYAGFRWKLLK